MTETPPTVYYLYGDDEFAITEFIYNLKDKLGDETAAELNYFQFNTSDLDWSNLEATAVALPFLSSRRLIVLDQAERLKKNPTEFEQLTELLVRVPPSTAFVVIERTSPSKGKGKSGISKLHQWMDDHDSFTFKRACITPHGTAFVTWLQKRASAEGGVLSKEAAELLSEWIEEDPRLATQELQKLLDYVDREREITIEDVEQCTPYRGETNIFALVDAIGLRHGSEAQGRLHEILQQEDPRNVFGMIVRQFRLIIRARECIDAGLPLNENVHHSDFVVKKVASQARNFTMPDLENIYRELLSIDLQSKQGQMDLDVALDRLVAAITN